MQPEDERADEGAVLQQAPAADVQDPAAHTAYLDAVTCKFYCYHCRLHLSYEALKADRHDARL
jgi:hypothetical protein